MLEYNVFGIVDEIIPYYHISFYIPVVWKIGKSTINYKCLILSIRLKNWYKQDMGIQC